MQNQTANIYDKLIIVFLACMSCGILFSPITLPRVLALLFLPLVIKHFNLIRKSLPIYVSLFLFAWLLIGGISIFYSYNPQNAVKFWIYNTCSISIFLEIFLFSLKAQLPTQSIVKGYMAMVLITSIVAFWEFGSGNHLSCNYFDELYLSGDITIERVYASVTFGNLNYYVVILCFALPFLLYGEYLEGINKKICILCILIIMFIIVINASRGGLLCLLLAILSALYYYRKNKVIRKSTILILIIIAFGVAIYFSDLLLVQIMSKLATEGGGADESRMNIYENCIEVLYLTNGFGSGMGGLEKALESVSPSDIPAPHNLLLEFLSQYGIIAFFTFVIFLMGMGSQIYKSQEWKSKMLGAIFIITFLPLSIINSVYLASTDVWTYFSCFLCIIQYNKYRGAKHNGKLQNKIV